MAAAFPKRYVQIQNGTPMLASVVPVPHAIPLSDANGTLLSWVTNLHTIIYGTSNIVTSSVVDVLVAGMTYTPPVAGVYLVTFTSASGNATSGANTVLSIYAGGVQQAGTKRNISAPVVSPSIGFACGGVVSITAGQAIEGRWSVASGTAAMADRLLTVLKIG